MSSATETPNTPANRVRTVSRTKRLVSLGLLTAIAYAVMLLSKLLPQVMGFLQFDLKDTVICIGGFIFGPVAAAMVTIVVAFLEMISASGTGLIGFLMNVLATCAFCCTASFIYKKKHTMAGAIIGLVSGVIALTALMLLWCYIAAPIYFTTMDRASAVSLLFPVLVPFNLVKGGINMAAILLLYKPVVSALRKAHLVAPSEKQKGKFTIGYLLLTLVLLATFVLLMLVLAGII